jgi:Flp pilus assembly protein TadG
MAIQLRNFRVNEMKRLFKGAVKLKSERGVTVVLVAFMIVMFISIAALAVDIGYLMVSKNELQNAADASALAAARKLGAIYQTLSYIQQQTYVCNSNDIIPVAKSTAASNLAATQSVTVLDADVVIGTWDSATKVLTPTLNQPDAVGVTTRRDNTPGILAGPVGTFFARIFNVQNVPVTATAIAALTGQGTAEPGELLLPVGVSESKFTGDPDSWCGQVIKFSPTTDPDACAGWTTYTTSPASDSRVRDILNGGLESPAVIVADTEFYFINGNLSSNTFEALLQQYQNHGNDVDKIYNPADISTPGYVYPAPVSQGVPLCMTGGGSIVQCGTAGTILGNQLRYPPCSGNSGCSGPLRYSHEWETTVAVYASNDCTPAGSPISIAGFAYVVVYNVGTPSNMVIEARIKCDVVEPDPTRGGGGYFGKKSPIPNLVK